MPPSVNVLGGGVSGLTTAVILQALGFRVALFTEHAVRQKIGSREFPLIPSEYAMASAYPHNLRVKNLERISTDSQAIFAFLQELKGSGVSTYKIFEVFEDEPAAPPLGDQRRQFQQFDGKPNKLAHTVNPPVRPGAQYLYGWLFDSYFVDMPIYLEYLWQMFSQRGGILREQRLDKEAIATMGGDAIVNCLGIAAGDLFTDSTPALMMRGKQVFVPNAPILDIAYNYTPSSDIFCRADGSPEYVHFFARSDGWILGQTREPGTIDEFGEWQGSPVRGDSVILSDIAIPMPILTLNEAILVSWIRTDLNERTLIGREGYRYYRDPDDSGVRLQSEFSQGKFVVHNYGHGGSGVTMSWGCSIEAARILQLALAPQPPESQGFSSFDHLITTRVFAD